RAIQKFQRKYNAFPASIDALLQTDGVRFLRKEYVDPITGDSMRIITVNPDGSLSGSLVYQHISAVGAAGRGGRGTGLPPTPSNFLQNLPSSQFSGSPFPMSSSS